MPVNALNTLRNFVYISVEYPDKEDGDKMFEIIKKKLYQFIPNHSYFNEIKNRLVHCDFCEDTLTKKDNQGALCRWDYFMCSLLYSCSLSLSLSGRSECAERSGESDCEQFPIFTFTL